MKPLRHLHQCLDCFLREVEQFFLTSAQIEIFLCIHRERHDHTLRNLQKLSHEVVLDRCKSGKFIKNKHTVPQNRGILCQLGKNI